MSASVHFFNAESGYAVARRVLCTTDADPEAEDFILRLKANATGDKLFQVLAVTQDRPSKN
jgi:hypothetical protein